ncbi:MAG: hypothetical protein Q4D82_06875 [Neisseria sp.]|nr:hypothetical protein [Neisseria sp.]
MRLNERGFVLFMVLMAVLALAALSAAALHAFGGASYIGANAADRCLAEHFADAALNEGIAWAEQNAWSAADFRASAKADCTGGFCAAGTELVQRKCLDKKGKEVLCLVQNGRRVSGRIFKALLETNGSVQTPEPRYAAELLSADGRTMHYRISAWARGKNANTQVVREHYLVWHTAETEEGGDAAENP